MQKDYRITRGNNKGGGFKVKRKETVFNNEIINSFNALGIAAMKIPDSPAMTGCPAFNTCKNPMKPKFQMGARFTPTKKYDIVADVDGEYVAIESKYLNKYKSLSLEMFRKRNKKKELINCQVTNLLKHKRCYIFVNIFNPLEMNRLIYIERPRIERLLEGESIKKDELESLPYINGRKYLYDLTVILK